MKNDIYIKYSSLCAKAEYCAFDIECKLIREDLTGKEVAEIIARLYAENFINDERYCHAYIHDKLEYLHWGKHKIRTYLRHKEIPSEIIDKVFGQISQEHYIKILHEVLQRKKQSLGIEMDSEMDYRTKAKIINYAVGKGFEYDAIVNELD